MNASKDQVQIIARQTWFAFLFAEGIGVLITGSALVDMLFGLGWGYDWNTVLIGTGMLIFGVFLWLVCRAIFRFTARIAK